MTGLTEVHAVLNTIENATGSEKARLAKEALDAPIPWLKKVVKAAYGGSRYYTKSLEHFTAIQHESDTERIFDLLHFLAEKGSCSNADNWNLSKEASINNETVNIVERILNSDLRCGLGKKTWQKLIPELKVKFFEPMLAEKDIDKFLKYAGSWENAFWSIKYDGVRCITHIKSPDDIRMFSRTGKEFHNFGHIKDELKELFEKQSITYPCILDGEIVHDDGFQTLMQYVTKKNCPSLRDVVLYKVFDFGQMNFHYATRYRLLLEAFQYGKYVSTVVQNWCISMDKQMVLADARVMIAQGHEGIILRTRDGIYENKRSRQLCKIKALYLDDKKTELDLNVVTVVEGLGQYADSLGAFTCTYKGKSVKIGSGLTDAQRDEFWNRPPKVIEVHAESITKDGSLRHPVFSKVKEY